jgi:hypothetical protein
MKKFLSILALALICFVLPSKATVTVQITDTAGYLKLVNNGATSYIAKEGVSFWNQKTILHIVDRYGKDYPITYSTITVPSSTSIYNLMSILSGYANPSNRVTYLAARDSANNTLVVKSTAGTLHAIQINTKGASANTITVYNNAVASGTPIAIIDGTGASGFYFVYDKYCPAGITVKSATGTAADFTVIYK